MHPWHPLTAPWLGITGVGGDDLWDETLLVTLTMITLSTLHSISCSISYTCAGRLFQNVPILCGGFFGVARYDCYGLKNRIWTNISDLNEPREFGSATVISVPDDKEYLLVTGNNFTQPSLIKYRFVTIIHYNRQVIGFRAQKYFN